MGGVELGNVCGYAAEEEKQAEHMKRWHRVLKALGETKVRPPPRPSCWIVDTFRRLPVSPR